MRLRVVALCGAGLLSMLVLLGQGVDESEIHVTSWPYSPIKPHIQVQTNVVEVGVVVRDAKGKAIGELKKEDLELRDNNKPQAIASFSVLNANSPGGTPPAGDKEYFPGAKEAPPPRGCRNSHFSE